MTRLKLDRSQLDHPEHFDDEIRSYRDSSRYRPTLLEQLLFELAGHRCTICSAPWLEIHHIEELSQGGQTTFDNLIVLCPNCHTRVHRDGIPSTEELRHYKLKQEIAYELPVLSRLAEDERRLVRELASSPPQDLVIFSKRYHQDIQASSQDDAIAICRRTLGLAHLQESGIVSVEESFVVTHEDGTRVSVSLNIRLTGKGVKWVRYLVASNRVPND